MRFVTVTVLALGLTALALRPALAEEVVFTGKTFSPDHTEVLSPHATKAELKIFEDMSKELKARQGEDAEPPVGPFTGRMKVTKVLADIGQKVNLEQVLLEYAYPLEDLISERRKLSQADLLSLDATLDRTRADIADLHHKLDEARMRKQMGAASDQEISDLVREIQVTTLKEQLQRDQLRMDRDQASGDLELAKAKFGLKTDEHHLPGMSWVTSPVAGYVLWVNPEVKPGVILTKSTKLFVVGPLDPILIRALVYEKLASRLRVGDKAEVTFQTLPGKTFEATISRIPMTGVQLDTQLPTDFEVELTLPNPDLKLKEGMRGQCKVTVPDGPR
jgi:multidrug efflux pump subunit AcrA (membrane-fusion protein)